MEERHTKAGKKRKRLPPGDPRRTHDGRLFQSNPKRRMAKVRMTEHAEQDPRLWSQARIRAFERSGGNYERAVERAREKERKDDKATADLNKLDRGEVTAAELAKDYSSS